MILSVFIVSQFIDFSIISAVAEESGEPSVIQNEQAESSSGDPDEPSQEESEPEEVIRGEQIEYDNLSVDNGYTLSEDKEVNNVILSGGILDLNGHSLVVRGDFTVSYGTLYINRGYLNCLGDFSVSGYNSLLTMDNVNDKILVSGDFEWDHAQSDSISNGVIEVKGDFKDNTTNSGYNFVSTGNNKVLLSGDSEQIIEQKSAHSFINILELDNHSQDGISAVTPILAGTIIKNGCVINYPISGRYGYKLTQNDTIQGDVYLIGDELDLNGKTLNITGNLIQAAGKDNINGGTLNVAGDYLIESYTMDNDNNRVYDYSSGYLIMQNENDRVNVDGDFIMGSVQDHTGLLTSGVMNIKGDFEQKVFNKATNFSASGTHKVVFNGTDSQTITFADSTKNTSHFACVEFANLNQDGVHIADGVMAIGEVSNVGAKPIGHIYLDSTAVIKNNSISANLKFPNYYTLADDLTVNGYIIVTGGINLAGKTLEVNNFTLQNSVVKINKGQLVCNGSVYLNSKYWYNTYIEMSNHEDHVIVNGDFVSENVTVQSHEKIV